VGSDREIRVDQAGLFLIGQARFAALSIHSDMSVPIEFISIISKFEVNRFSEVICGDTKWVSNAVRRKQ